jgi:hypothetical protein
LDGGGLLYPSLLDEVLYEIRGLVDYRARLTRLDGKTCLQVEAEVISPESNALRDIRRKLVSIPAIAKGLAMGEMSEPKVSLADPGSFRIISRAKKLLA